MEDNKYIWLIIIVIIIVGVYFWQKSSSPEILGPPEEQGFEEAKPAINPVPIEEDMICTDEPTLSDIGINIYPIDPQYVGLNYLGQFFTANKCGEERLSGIQGVDGDEYTLGSTVWLYSNPDSLLIDAFKSIGFECADGNSEENCQYWRLKESVQVDDLLKLEPYSSNFKQDDCYNCG